MGVDNSIMMFILQGAMAVVMLLFGIVLNGMRASTEQVAKNVERVATELKILNDAVLGKYITRDDSDSKWRDQRVLDHELRGMIQACMVQIAKVGGNPYTGEVKLP